MKSVVIFDGDGTENRQDPEESKQALKIFLLTRFFLPGMAQCSSQQQRALNRIEGSPQLVNSSLTSYFAISKIVQLGRGKVEDPCRILIRLLSEKSYCSVASSFATVNYNTYHTDTHLAERRVSRQKNYTFLFFHIL